MSARVKLLRLLGAAMVTLAVVPWLGSAPAVADDVDGQKVTLCHRTNAETNPYVKITVSINSVFKTRGHDSHNGPIFEPGMKDDGIRWGDIIPAFDYPHGNGTAHYAGKNWPEGQVLLDSGCDDNQLCPEATDDPDDGDSEDGDQRECSLPTVTVTNTVTETATATVTQTVSNTSTVTQTVNNTATVTEPGPTQTVTTIAPGPTQTVTQTNQGPTVTVTVTAPGPTTTTTLPATTHTVTVTETGPTQTVTQKETVTAPGPTVTVTGPSSTLTVTQTLPAETVTGPGSTQTVTTTAPGSTETVTTTVTVPGQGETVTTTAPGSTETVTTTAPGEEGATETVTVTETVSDGTSVLPTKIGTTPPDDTDVEGTKTGVLAETGLSLPMGAVLGISFALLISGGALMVVPARMATERRRRH